MRSTTILRNYGLLIFFVILVGGTLLQPGNREAARPSQAHAAGFSQ
jgi:hypothetical protein